MIEVAVAKGARVFVGELGAGERAYVDADWLSGVAQGPVPALLVQKSSLVATWDGQVISLPDQKPTELSVAGALMRTAAAAAAEVGASGRPAVGGSGFVAGVTRLLLGSGEDSTAPDLIVETRGDHGSLLESTQRVADLGTVVLAGAPAVEPFSFDLYPDVHVRGLRVVALPFTLAENTADADGGRLELVGSAEAVHLGEPFADARWYRITSR